jgi:hypothetical protein
MIIIHNCKATAYYPSNTALEGGTNDCHGYPLATLQNQIVGICPFTSVAMDPKLPLPYGSILRIPELEAYFHRRLTFLLVDNGSAFEGKLFSRIDICTQNYASSLQPIVNGLLTLHFWDSLQEATP